jgi:hypothetical protein
LPISGSFHIRIAFCFRLIPYWTRLIIANAIVAGTISELTGGKFANGAMSAAFRVAFDSLGSRFNNDQWGSDLVISEDKTNSRLRRKINVSSKNGTTYITGTFKVWNSGDKISETDFLSAVTAMETGWDGNYTTFSGNNVEVDFEFKVAKYKWGSDIRIYGMDKVVRRDGSYVAGYVNKLGGKKMFLTPNVGYKTPAHEFGHSLGLGHELNPTFAMMSYNRYRLTNIADINDLISLYKR